MALLLDDEGCEDVELRAKPVALDAVCGADVAAEQLSEPSVGWDWAGHLGWSADVCTWPSHETHAVLPLRLMKSRTAR